MTKAFFDHTSWGHTTKRIAMVGVRDNLSNSGMGWGGERPWEPCWVTLSTVGVRARFSAARFCFSIYKQKNAILHLIGITTLVFTCTPVRSIGDNDFLRVISWACWSRYLEQAIISKIILLPRQYCQPCLGHMVSENGIVFT